MSHKHIGNRVISLLLVFCLLASMFLGSIPAGRQEDGSFVLQQSEPSPLSFCLGRRSAQGYVQDHHE